MLQTAIAESAIIGSNSQLGEDSRIGEYTVIEDGVQIGRRCEISHNVVIHAGTVIGDDVRIDSGSVVGKQPMRSRNSATTRESVVPPARIGNGTMIGANSVVYAGCELGESVLVADLATVREDVTVGDFTIVGRGVSIENHCTVGRYCKLETNVYVTAYSTIEDRVFLAPGALTSNDNYMGRTEERFKHFKGATIRRGGRIGVGAVLLPGVEIEPDAVVAAGAVQTRTAQSDTIYAGVPAKPFRDVPEEQKLDNQGWKDIK